MTIMLHDIWPIENLSEYKIHFARWNGQNQPLDVFARNRKEWQGWQEFKPRNNVFNRPLIFSLAQFYHEPNVWLFGGVFRVLSRHSDHYDVELTGHGQRMNGRLKLLSPYRTRNARPNMEDHYKGFEVQEILCEPYSRIFS